MAETVFQVHSDLLEYQQPNKKRSRNLTDEDSVSPWFTREKLAELANDAEEAVSQAQAFVQVVQEYLSLAHTISNKTDPRLRTLSELQRLSPNDPPLCVRTDEEEQLSIAIAQAQALAECITPFRKLLPGMDTAERGKCRSHTEEMTTDRTGSAQTSGDVSSHDVVELTKSRHKRRSLHVDELRSSEGPDMLLSGDKEAWSSPPESLLKASPICGHLTMLDINFICSMIRFGIPQTNASSHTCGAGLSSACQRGNALPSLNRLSRLIEDSTSSTIRVPDLRDLVDLHERALAATQHISQQRHAAAKAELVVFQKYVRASMEFATLKLRPTSKIETNQQPQSSDGRHSCSPEVHSFIRDIVRRLGELCRIRMECEEAVIHRQLLWITCAASVLRIRGSLSALPCLLALGADLSLVRASTEANTGNSAYEAVAEAVRSCLDEGCAWEERARDLIYREEKVTEASLLEVNAPPWHCRCSAVVVTDMVVVY